MAASRLSSFEINVEDEITISDSENKSANDDLQEATGRKRRKGGRYSGDEKSAVWQYFDYDVLNKKSQCRECGHHVPGKHAGDLKKHLYRNHKSVYERVEIETDQRRPAVPALFSERSSPALLLQLTLPDCLTKAIPYAKDSKRYLDLLNSLALLFASHSLAHSLVETTEFRQFCAMLDPKFDLPNRRRLAMTISDLFRDLKQKLLLELKNVKVCVILDIWSKRGLSESYLGLLVQYFDRQTLLIKKALIALRKLEGSHTGANIKSVVESVLIEWEIPEENVLYYVTDNGSNVVKALESYVNQFKIMDLEFAEENEDDSACGPGEEGEVDANIENSLTEAAMEDVEQFQSRENDHSNTFSHSKRIPCIAHQLACIVRRCVDGSPSIRPTLSAAVKLINKVNKSGRNKELFLANNNGKGLLAPSNTRWIFTYDMLKRLLQSKEAVEKVVIEKNLSDVSLNSVQWTRIEQIIELLEPFQQTVRELEGDSYCTLSKVIPAIIGMADKLNSLGSGSISAVKASLKTELDQLSLRLLNPESLNFNPAHLLATFLDPAFVIGLSNSQRDQCIEIVMSNLASKTVSEQTVFIDARATIEKLTSEEKYGAFFKNAQHIQIRSKTSAIDRGRLIKANLERYIDQAIERQMNNDAPSTDPIRFWVENIDTFAEIATFALNILCIPASSAGIERAFSLASVVQGGKRFRLSAESTEMELMIKINRNYLF